MTFPNCSTLSPPRNQGPPSRVSARAKHKKVVTHLRVTPGQKAYEVSERRCTQPLAGTGSTDLHHRLSAVRARHLLYRVSVRSDAFAPAVVALPPRHCLSPPAPRDLQRPRCVVRTMVARALQRYRREEGRQRLHPDGGRVGESITMTRHRLTAQGTPPSSDSVTLLRRDSSPCQEQPQWLSASIGLSHAPQMLVSG